jgi:hypothetical protein
VGYPEHPQFEMKYNPMFLPQGSPALPTDFYNNKKVSKILTFKDLKKLSRTGKCPDTKCSHKFTNSGLFFMYVHQVDDGTNPLTEAIPCCCNKETTVAVAANLYPIYNTVAKLIDGWNATCNDNKNQDLLIDLYLKKQIFLDAIEMEDYCTAIKIWHSSLFKDVRTGDCLNGCNNSGYSGGSYDVGRGCRTCG